MDHPKDPMPGQVCRVGATVGVRAYDELYETWERGRSGGGGTHEPTMERIYGEGRKPVTFHHTTWQVRVRNQGAQTAGAGRIVHYYDQLVGPDGDQSNCAVQETVAVPDATVGLLLEPVPPQSLAVVLVLMQYAPRDWHWLSCPAVQRSPGVLSGAWVFRGTRMPVSDLFDHLSWDETIGDFVENFPAVSEAQVVAVLRHVAQDLAKYATRHKPRCIPRLLPAPKGDGIPPVTPEQWLPAAQWLPKANRRRPVARPDDDNR